MKGGNIMGSVTFLTNLDKAEIGSRLADLEYVPIEIISFTNNVGTVEIGSTIKSVVFEWKLNKRAEKQNIGSMSVSAILSNYMQSGLNVTQNTSWTLRVSDERSRTVEKTTSITFLNGVYYGVAESVETIDSNFVLGLSKTLTSTKSRTINVTADSGQHIYYCVPTRFGTCNFNVGGFDGGFEKVTTFDFTNSFSYTESYDVYKSSNSGLGSTTIKIT